MMEGQTCSYHSSYDGGSGYQCSVIFICSRLVVAVIEQEILFVFLSVKTIGMLVPGHWFSVSVQAITCM